MINNTGSIHVDKLGDGEYNERAFNTYSQEGHTKRPRLDSLELEEKRDTEDLRKNTDVLGFCTYICSVHIQVYIYIYVCITVVAPIRLYLYNGAV